MNFLRRWNAQYDCLLHPYRLFVMLAVILPGIILISVPLFQYSVGIGYLYLGGLLIMRVWWLDWTIE